METNKKEKWLSSSALKKGDYVFRYYKDHAEAKYFYDLFKDFPHHVNPTKLKENYFVYKFVKGKSLKELLENKNAKKKLFWRLGNFLAKVHFSSTPIKIDNYQKVCALRNNYPNKQVFKNKCYSFFSKIHGDLTSKHIIITPKGSFYLIERLRDRDDILFDFPIVLSLLSYYKITKDNYYLENVRNFLNAYSKDAPNDKLFWRAFSYHLINYGYFAFNFKHKFSEWIAAREVADDLVKIKNIWKYLEIIKKYN